MRKKNGLLAFVSGFLLLTVIVKMRTVGVHEGDWFEYGNVEFNWTSNDPSAKPPSEYMGLNETEWMRTTVQEISGTKITGQIITHYTNGSEIIEGYWIDVDTGQGNGSILFIAANLEAGDLVYTDPTIFGGAK